MAMINTAIYHRKNYDKHSSSVVKVNYIFKLPLDSSYFFIMGII